MRTIYKYSILLFLLLGCFLRQSVSADVTVVLKNGRQVIGRIIQEEAGYLWLDMELGELKISRENIERVADAPFADLRSAAGDSTQLDDQIVVHLTNGKVIDGFLIAKSRSMIMIQSEMGRLTIPKTEVAQIEYVSAAFAEQGEPVRLELTSGKRLEGYLQAEDRSTLTISTDLGKLTIDKRNLSSLQYNISPKFEPLSAAEVRRPDPVRHSGGTRDLIGIGCLENSPDFHPDGCPDWA